MPFAVLIHNLVQLVFSSIVSFTARMLRHWNGSPKDVVDAPSLETFRMRLDKALGNLI